MTNLEDDLCLNLKIEETLIERAERRKGMKILGAIVTADNVATAPLEYSIQKAWAAFNRHKKVLCCKNANMRPRFCLLNRFVLPVLRYCAGSLHLTKVHFGYLRRIQNTMMKKTAAHTDAVAPPAARIPTPLLTPSVYYAVSIPVPR